MTPTSIHARTTAKVEASAPVVWPKPPAGINVIGAVGLTDLARFEGEGGREAPDADAIEVPPDAAISQ